MSKFMWDPETGARHIFKDGETAPDNFLPHHPDDADKADDAPKKAAKADKDLSGGMTKAEIESALQSGGVTYDKQGTKADMLDALIPALWNALEASGVEFDADATAPELLGLLKGE